MLQEASQHEYSAFITLTFDEDQLGDNQVQKDTAQKFIKRLRQHLNKKIKYFITGEYGDTSGRAHYHAIIFGLETCGECKVCTKIDRARGKMPKEGTDCEALLKSWTKGMIHAGTVEPASTRYVADYLQKDTREESYGNRNPPFSLKSQGLGKEWAKKNVTPLTCALGIPAGGSRAPVPRYYIQKTIERSETPELTEYIIKAARIRQALKYDEKRNKFWKERNRSPIHAKYKADIQADKEKRAYNALREGKI